MTQTVVGNRLNLTRWLLVVALENGGIMLRAYLEQFRQSAILVLDETWTINGVSEEEGGRISFLATPDGSRDPIRFVVGGIAAQTNFNLWLERLRKSFRRISETHNPRIVPFDITFIVGVTHHVPGLKQHNRLTIRREFVEAN